MIRIFSYRSNKAALNSCSSSLLRYRELLFEMTYRDLIERHSASALGSWWVICQPLIVMLIQTLVFTFVFKLRLSGDNSGISYVAYLLVGLAPWLAFQEAIGRAPFCFFESKNLVKQVVFPIEILPVKIVLASVVPLLVGLIFPLGIMIVTGSSKFLWWILLPFALAIQLLMTIGVTYFISALSVYLRDTKTLVQLFLMVGLFLHPILYTPGMLPDWAETAFQLSPLSHLLWVYRDILIFGQVTHPESWILAPIFALLSVAWGYRFFSNLAPRFGDVL